MLAFCDCGGPSFQQVFGCEVQPDLPPGHSDHEKGPVPAAGEDAEPEVDEKKSAAEEVGLKKKTDTSTRNFQGMEK